MGCWLFTIPAGMWRWGRAIRRCLHARRYRTTACARRSSRSTHFHGLISTRFATRSFVNPARTSRRSSSTRCRRRMCCSWTTAIAHSRNSDVTVFFTEIANLPQGMVYGLHDIFLPWDYPEQWSNRFYRAISHGFLPIGRRERRRDRFTYCVSIAFVSECVGTARAHILEPKAERN